MSRHVEHILLAVLLTTAALAFMGALFVEALPDRGGHVKQRRRSWRLDFDDVSRPRLDGSAGQPPPAAGPGHPEDYDPEFWGETYEPTLGEVLDRVERRTGGAVGFDTAVEAIHEGRHDDETCPNCGRWGFDGTLCNACGWGYGWQPAYEAQVTAIIPPGECLCIIGNDMGCVTTNTHNCPAHGTLDRDPDTIIDSKPRVAAGRHARPEAAWDVYLREGVPPSLEYVLAALTLPLPQVKALAAAS